MPSAPASHYERIQPIQLVSTNAEEAKADNDYYLGRLEKENPPIHADFLAGK